MFLLLLSFASIIDGIRYAFDLPNHVVAENASKTGAAEELFDTYLLLSSVLARYSYELLNS
jgi:hypothetical protein